MLLAARYERAHPALTAASKAGTRTVRVMRTVSGVVDGVQKTLCGPGELYFTEPEAVKVLCEFRQAMCRLSLAINARNELRQHYYDNVCPQVIAASQYYYSVISFQSLINSIYTTSKTWRMANSRPNCSF